MWSLINFDFENFVENSSGSVQVKNIQFEALEIWLVLVTYNDLFPSNYVLWTSSYYNDSAYLLTIIFLNHQLLMNPSPIRPFSDGLYACFTTIS